MSDAENVLGIVQIENIQILAEAYDVALSISISKGQWMPLKTKVVQVHCIALPWRWATKARGTGWDSVRAWHGCVKPISCELRGHAQGCRGCQGTASLEALVSELWSMQLCAQIDPGALEQQGCEQVVGNS